MWVTGKTFVTPYQIKGKINMPSIKTYRNRTTSGGTYTSKNVKKFSDKKIFEKIVSKTDFSPNQMYVKGFWLAKILPFLLKAFALIVFLCFSAFVYFGFFSK